MDEHQSRSGTMMDKGTRNAAIIFGLIVLILIAMYFFGAGKDVVN
jgi:hypothetical protein